ncbi:MAG: Mrp/NBP35 family ATP-binding protein [Herpetosiphonaceae bacterium]|nr:Mrp/NBP35 family ATP-binding protein [Herpetosiphonaceae bacterium]
MGIFGRRDGVNEAAVMAALGTVQEPELGGDLVSRKMIKDLVIEGGQVMFTVELTTPACPLKDEIETESRAAVLQVKGVTEVTVKFSSNVRARPGLFDKAGIPGVKNVVAIASGKGGVGKSTVAVNTAIALAQYGARVGLLDADVYGPSAPLMTGALGQPVPVNGKLQPLEAYDLKIMSVGFMVAPDQPIIWRGPMVSSLLRQFLYEVNWGELDYLIIDLPPGTGDIQLTLAQAIPLTGAVIVTTPQDVALSDVVRGIEMFRKLNVPILGVIENMSYFACPHCGERSEIFSHGGGERTSTRMDVPFLGEIPLSIAIRSGGDAGQPAVTSEAPEAQAEAFRAVARTLAGRISVEGLA